MSSDDVRPGPRWTRWLFAAAVIGIAALARERAFTANRQRFGPPGPPPVTD